MADNPKKIRKYLELSEESCTFALAFDNGSWPKDSLAQLVEHNTFNVGVMGSSPIRVTK